MTSRPTLPPEVETWLAGHPDLSPGDLAPPWRLAEGANPMDAAPAPDPARIQAIAAALTHAARNGAVQRPALRLVTSARWVTGLALAACIAVLLAVGLFLWQQPITVSAPYGETARVVLPDDSEVELNSGSTLRYARRFDQESRRVTLEGEAFFDVAKAGTPFVIETFNARVTVLGTSFNVRAWRDDHTAATVVSVVEGLVEVTAKTSPDETTRLEAGEAAHVAAINPVPPQPELARLDEATAWREDRFVFINQPLGMMFNEIERRFGIEIAASEAIRAHRHNIKTPATSAEQLVNEICQSSSTLKLRYRATANGFEVFEM